MEPLNIKTLLELVSLEVHHSLAQVHQAEGSHMGWHLQEACSVHPQHRAKLPQCSLERVALAGLVCNSAVPLNLVGLDQELCLQVWGEIHMPTLISIFRKLKLCPYPPNPLNANQKRKKFKNQRKR